MAVATGEDRGGDTMMESRLHAQLGALERKLRQAQLSRQLMFCWIATAIGELLLLATSALTGWNVTVARWLVLICGLSAAWWIRKRLSRPPRSGDLVIADRFDKVVNSLNREHPEIRHLLSAAAEQEPNPETGEFGFLQLRVIDEAVNHPATRQWRDTLARKASAAKNTQLLALLALLAVFYFGHSYDRPRGRSASVIPFFGKEIVVTPGDTQLERGSGLVISARFGHPPPEASLVLISDSGKTQRLPMARTLSDPVFGATLMEVAESATYRVEYSGRKTRDFKIRVFEFPALTRADADLVFPSYTGLTNRTIRDTLRVSAVEGSRLTYTLQLNKPVAQARMVGKERSLPLIVDTNAVAALGPVVLTNSARYSLQLIDAEGRTNKAPTEFVIQVLSNLPPELKITFPNGDPRVSRLEELQLQAEARDDFGMLKYGIGFGVTGQNPQFVELGQGAAANEKRQFNTQIALEKLGVEEDQLVSYFAWAEDYGPDGLPRRTFSDIFFAEVRPFDEIFRQDQSGASESQNQGQNGGQNGNQNPRLAELQKQIVIATWKLQQAKPVASRGSNQ